MAVDIESAFVQWLLSKATLTARVGVKIEPFKTNQKISRPFIVYTERNHERKRCLTGNSGLSKVHYQLDIVAETEAEVNLIRGVIVDLLDDPPFSGTMDTVYVPYAYIDNQMHHKEDHYGTADDWPFHKALIVCINYKH